MKQNRSSGQILLITLLVLTVGMTIALAMIGRTRTNVTIGNEIEDSARAFGAAEAGIEQALKTGTGTGSGAQTLSGGISSFTTSVSQVGAAAGAYSFKQKTTKGDTETLWLVNHNADGSLNEGVRGFTSDTIDLCWKGSGSTPALAVTVLFKRGSNYHVAKAAYDPDGARRGSNRFADAGGLTNGCSQANVYRRVLSFSSLGVSPAINAATDTLIALRIRPVYADAFLYAHSGAVVLPSQGDIINSTGSTNTGVSRKIIVTRQFRSAPTVFDAAVVSQTIFTH